MSRTTRQIALLFVLAFTMGLFTACPSWVPKKTGACNAGRTWVPPVEQDGKWQPGYCKDSG